VGSSFSTIVVHIIFMLSIKFYDVVSFDIEKLF